MLSLSARIDECTNYIDEEALVTLVDSVKDDFHVISTLLSSFKSELEESLGHHISGPEDQHKKKSRRAVEDDIDEIRHRMKKIKKHQRKIGRILDELEMTW
jgi:biopolymer transport protein ExbB/TolQ